MYQCIRKKFTQQFETLARNVSQLSGMTPSIFSGKHAHPNQVKRSEGALRSKCENYRGKKQHEPQVEGKGTIAHRYVVLANLWTCAKLRVNPSTLNMHVTFARAFERTLRICTTLETQAWARSNEEHKSRKPTPSLTSDFNSIVWIFKPWNAHQHGQRSVIRARKCLGTGAEKGGSAVGVTNKKSGKQIRKEILRLENINK